MLALTLDNPGGVAQLRHDRILHEAIASNGYTRRLCDMFGLSITTASRYTNAIRTATITKLTTHIHTASHVLSRAWLQ